MAAHDKHWLRTKNELKAMRSLLRERGFSEESIEKLLKLYKKAQRKAETLSKIKQRRHDEKTKMYRKSGGSDEFTCVDGMHPRPGGRTGGTRGRGIRKG